MSVKTPNSCVEAQLDTYRLCRRVLSGVTGGALLLSGGLRLEGVCSFVANEASIGGLAIQNFGELEHDVDGDVIFANNSFHCPLGQYSFDADTSVSWVRAVEKHDDH